MDRKILVGYSTDEFARRSDFYDHLNMMLQNHMHEAVTIPAHQRSPARARNMLIDKAIEEKCTHVLIIDDDCIYAPNALQQLLEHDKDIVSGLYLSKAYPHQPIVFDVSDDEGACLPMYLMGNEGRLKKIEAAGFGFLLMKTSIFSKLEKPYVRLGELNSEEWCDDIGFFKRIREAGIKAYCDMECYVGHIGSMIIWPRKYKGKWYVDYDTAGSGRISTPMVIPNEALKV